MVSLKERVMGNISCFSKDADHHHTIESRELHLIDMEKRPSFNGEWEQHREAERRLCYDEISHAKFCLSNKVGNTLRIGF